MPHGPPRRRRARPVADAPVDALLLRGEDLAKGWLLALLEQAPLDDAPAILAGDLSRDGPRVCDAVVRALSDDGDLRRLEAGGALEPLAAQAGAFGPGADGARVSQTVDALHGVIWSALRGELSDPDAEQVSELSERLALVIEHVRGAALRAAASWEAPPAMAPGEGAARGVEGPSLRVASTPASAPVSASASASAPPAEPGGGTESLWKGALGDEIARATQSGAPLSLLIVELADAERVVAVEGQIGAGAAIGRFAPAVRSAVRRGDLLACENDTRAWIIAPNTGRLGAQALADRVAAAVRAAEPWRGAPLGVSAGIAVFREDGMDVGELIGAAEEARYAAEASGVAVIREAGVRTGGFDPESDPAV